MSTGLRWDVADHATATAVLTCPELGRTPPEPTPPLTAHVLNCEGRPHRALRTAVRNALDRACPAVATHTAAAARRLLHGLAGEVDVAAEWVRPVALLVLASTLGLPGDELAYWHRAAVLSDCGLPAPVADDVTARLGRLLDERRASPRADVMSAIADVEDASREQRIATAFFTVHAGYVNMVNLLGRALLALAQHPAEYHWLRRQDLVASPAVEELLRFAEVPERASMRVATRDVRIGGRAVPAGTRIYVRRGRANRDERRYADPDRLDLRRAAPAGSLAFGAGRHSCPAGDLVRIVTGTALTVFVRDVRVVRPSLCTDHDWDFARPLYLDLEPEPNLDRRTS